MYNPHLFIVPHECLIPKVHKRLDQAHQLWHDTERHYFEPDAFATYLNSCIQALRSSTWVLQKYKDLFPDFDSWYGTPKVDGDWQARMRKDSIMAWLVQARNRIEKQGDLEGKSLARVSLIASYLDNPPIDIEFAPLSTSKQMAKDIRQRIKVTPDDVEDASIQIERRWVDIELPDHEILEALAYAFSVLTELEADAHAKLGLPPPVRLYNPNVGDVREPIPFHGGKPACMVRGNVTRTTTVMLRTGKHASLVQKPLALNEESMRRAAERYGEPNPSLIERMGAAKTLRERTAAYFEMAKVLLKKDKYHRLMAHLFDSNGKPLKLIVLQIEDYASKFLMWRDVAREVEISGATSIIVIGEMWHATYNGETPLVKPADNPDRIEVLSVEAESMDGERVNLACSFSRDVNGEISFAHDEERRPEGPGFTEPIREVWRKWQSQAR